MRSETVRRSPGIYLIDEENLAKPQLEDRLMKAMRPVIVSNPDRSWRRRQTRFKHFWPQAMTSWAKGKLYFELYGHLYAQVGAKNINNLNTIQWVISLVFVSGSWRNLIGRL